MYEPVHCSLEGADEGFWVKCYEKRNGESVLFATSAEVVTHVLDLLVTV